MEDHFQYLEGLEERDEKSMTDLHLANAINLDHVEYLVRGEFNEYSIYVTNFQKRLWRDVRISASDVVIYDIGLLEPSLQVLTKAVKDAKINQTLYKELIKIVGRGLEKRGLSIPLVSSYEEISSRDILCKKKYMLCFRFLTQLVCMVSECSRGGTTSVYPNMMISGNCVKGVFQYGSINWLITINNSFCILQDRQTGRNYAGSFDSILLLMDTLGQRLCLDIGNQICQIGAVPGSTERKVLEMIIAMGDQILERYGNKGFNFIESYESIVVGVLLKKNPDPVTDANEFLNACRTEMVELVQDETFDAKIVELYDLFVKCMEHLDNDTLSNAFSLYRIWGHPRVDIRAGMEKVMKKAISNKEDSSRVGKLIVSQFRKMFLSEFYSKHHRYPPCTFTGPENYVKDCIMNDLPIAIDHPNYEVWFFEYVEIGKLWELPETYDACHILNDKAVSPTKSELLKSLKAGGGTVTGVQRRGIIRWLMSESIRCKSFLDKVDKEGLDEDSLIIGMYEKERELKIKARMFSLMSEEMRMYFVLTEEMISKYILKYFPQITMRDPLNIQIKKLWNISGISHKFSLDPTTNVDFEKWCLNMREELTLLLFRQMDQMFGYENLISRTHEIFRKSYIYSSSGKYLPPFTDTELVLDPPMCYVGHLGGFEGLRQKGWTVATICLLAYIADRLRVNVNLLGQGDNQVVRIYMPHNYWNNMRFDQERRVVEAKRILGNYMNNMISYFSEAGLPVKVKETWRSTRLYMYGKAMYLDGNALPQWSKKLLRSYALSNEGTLTVSGVIGTVATNLCAAAHASTKPDILYAAYLVLGEWSLEYLLKYHPFTRKSVRDGDEISFKIPVREGERSFESGQINLKRLMTTILLVPTAVGGSVTIPLTGFIVRGFPDNASEGYSWLKLLKSVESKYQSLFANWYSFLVNNNAEYDLLVQAPWSLNHKKPPTPTLKSRDEVRSFLLSGVFPKNNFLSNTTRIMSKFDRKQICNILCAGNNCAPLIQHELYRSFVHNYLDDVLQRVEKTRTVVKLTFQSGLRIVIVRRLMEIEHEFLGYLNWRGNKKGVVFSECATKQARDARNIGWNKKIKGLTTPHPLEFAFDRICDSHSRSCDGSDFIYSRIWDKGNFPPYLGSKVKTKVVSRQDVSLRAEPLVESTTKMLRYGTWLNLGENALNLLRTNLNVVCDTNEFEHIEDFEGTSYAGCVEHRFNPSCASEGCFINYSPQVGRRVFLSSDNMPRYGRGELNYTLHFQALYCMLQYNSAHSENTTYQHYHICCEECVVPVDDETDDIGDMSGVLERLYGENDIELIRNTLGYLDKKIQTMEEDLSLSSVKLKQVDSSDLDARRLRAGIHHSLALRCAMMIMYTKSEGPESLGMDDLQTFPRVYAYKVSSVWIVELVVEYLFIIKLARSQVIPSLRGYSEIRERLTLQVIKCSVDKFRGLASLCVGRTFTSLSKPLPTLNMGEYPEDSESFARAVKGEIINKLNTLIELSEDNRRIQVPSVGLTQKEELFLAAHLLIKSEKCETCMDNFWECFKNKSELTDCPHGHVRTISNKIELIPIGMDTAVKTMSSGKSKLAPQPIVPHGTLDRKFSVKIVNGVSGFDFKEQRRVVNLNIASNQIKDKLFITVPTSAMYKWDCILTNLSPRQYNHIIVLGDGVGMTSLVCARRFLSSVIHPTARLEKNRFIPQDLMSIQPYLSRYYKNVVGDLIESVSDDILDERWMGEMMTFMGTLDGPLLIISDLEGIGGNKQLTLKAFQLWGEVMDDINVDILYKVYLHEDWDQLLSECQLDVYTNVFCNAGYFESFITNMDFNIQEEGVEETFDPIRWRNMITDDRLSGLISKKEQNYKEAKDSCEKICRSVLSKNYLPFHDSATDYPRQFLLFQHLRYISSNFKAPYQPRLSDDHRQMLDATLVRISKGLKMLLIILYGGSIQSSQFFEGLRIVQVPMEHRIWSINEISTMVVIGNEDFVLSKKERRSALSMRQYYVKKGGSTATYVPFTIRDLYRDIETGRDMARNIYDHII